MYTYVKKRRFLGSNRLFLKRKFLFDWCVGGPRREAIAKTSSIVRSVINDDLDLCWNTNSAEKSLIALSIRDVGATAIRSNVLPFGLNEWQLCHWWWL